RLYRNPSVVEPCRDTFNASVRTPPRDGYPERPEAQRERKSGDRHKLRLYAYERSRITVAPQLRREHPQEDSRDCDEQGGDCEHNTERDAVEHRATREEQDSGCESGEAGQEDPAGHDPNA